MLDVTESITDMEVLNALSGFIMNEPQKIYVVDLETTCSNPNKAEVLQCSIIDGNGNTVFDEYFRPIDFTEWPKAQAVNNISPRDVKDCTSIIPYVEKINRIMSECALVITYNGNHFDLKILKGYGVSTTDEKYHLDICQDYAKYNGEIFEGNDVSIKFRLKKLLECYETLKNKANEAKSIPFLKGLLSQLEEKLAKASLHNSKDDCLVTLYCFYIMYYLHLMDAKEKFRKE